MLREAGWAGYTWACEQPWRTVVGHIVGELARRVDGEAEGIVEDEENLPVVQRDANP